LRFKKISVNQPNQPNQWSKKSPNQKLARPNQLFVVFNSEKIQAHCQILSFECECISFKFFTSQLSADGVKERKMAQNTERGNFFKTLNINRCRVVKWIRKHVYFDVAQWRKRLHGADNEVLTNGVQCFVRPNRGVVIKINIRFVVDFGTECDVFFLIDLKRHYLTSDYAFCLSFQRLG
jgi:hypothetical protein